MSSMGLQKSLRGNLCIPKGRFPRTTEHDVPHLLLKNKREIIILNIVAEKYSLNKNRPLSK